MTQTGVAKIINRMSLLESQAIYSFQFKIFAILLKYIKLRRLSKVCYDIMATKDF